MVRRDELEWAIAYERSLLPPGTRFPRNGDVFEALEDITLGFMTYRPPTYAHFQKVVIERGMRVRVKVSSADREPIVVAVQLVDAPGVEGKSVLQDGREHPEYDDYVLHIGTEKLNTQFRLVTSGP